jgi:hypothetical protein
MENSPGFNSNSFKVPAALSEEDGIFDIESDRNNSKI